MSRTVERKDSGYEANPVPIGVLQCGVKTDYIEAFQEAALPPPLRDIITFAEDEIVLGEGPRQGLRFRISYAPFAGIVLKALENAGNQWDQVAIIGPTQTGKTLLAQAIEAMHHLFETKEPLGLAAPTMDIAHYVWEAKLRPLIEKSRYANLLPDKGAGSKGGKTDHLTMRNGVRLQFFAAGGSDEQRSTKTVSKVIITEADKMDESGEASIEADPVTQIVHRTGAYGDAGSAVIECTISTEDGRINQEANVVGSGGRILIKCPYCNKYVWPERKNFVGWQEAENAVQAGRLARYACNECGKLWDEKDREKAIKYPVLVHKKQNISTTEAQSTQSREEKKIFAREKQKINPDSGLCDLCASVVKISGPDPLTWTKKMGITWNWLHVPPSMISMRKIGQEEWEAANTPEDSKTKRNKEKALCQFRWAIPYEEKTETRRLTVRAVNSHATDYEFGHKPDGVEFTIGSIDVQKKWCYWIVYGYNLKLTRWLIAYSVVRFLPDGQDDRDPTAGQVKNGLDEAHEALKEYSPLYIPVDVGYKAGSHMSSAVREWIMSRKGKLRPIVGRAKGQIAAMKKTGKSMQLPPGCDFVELRRQDSGEQLFFLNVDDLKSDFQGSFYIPLGENGCIYLFKQTAKWGTYARHICSEHQEIIFVPGKGWTNNWIKTKKRNDLLDGSAYAEAFAMLHAAMTRAKAKAIKKKHKRSVNNRTRPTGGAGIRRDY